MKRRTLLAVLLTAPLLVAPTCMQQLLGARIDYLRTGSLISPDGSVAVGLADPTHVWRNGVVVELEHPLDLWPFDLSNEGRVIVGYGWRPDGESDDHAYRWKEGVVTDLSPSAISGQAASVSANGDVVVGTVADPSLPGGGGGVMWLGDVMVPVATEDGFHAETAESVSADGGAIAGQATHPDGSLRRYLWRGGEITWVDGLPDALDLRVWRSPWQSSFPPEILLSADGTTLVHYDHVPGPGGRREQTFRWRDGVTEPLGGLDGAPYTNLYAMAVSSNGEVVTGFAVTPDAWVAAIWDPTHGTRSLEALLTELGVTLPEGVHLLGATDMSADGRRILGSVTGHDFYHAFVATLPPACADHLDNDGDGLTDFPQDKGCASLFDTSEDPRAEPER